MKYHFFTLLLSITFGFVFGQGREGTPYKIRYQTFVNGGMKVIGNNIVNRNASFSSANKPYDDLGASSKHNDQFSMEYIDIDDDSSTFSSSSAYLNLPQEVNRITYAGLYWAATYPYNKGTSKDMRNFKIQDESRDSFNRVLLKLPNKSSYSSVVGNLIFDGNYSKGFKDNMPYVMYADITNQIQTLGDASGEYTVANIRAAQGQVLGGVSGGWTMIVVYESEGSATKKIITYDGFEDIFREKVIVDFTGFRTPDQGIIKAEFAGSALEGDNNIPGSRLAISTPGKTEYFLSTKTRSKRNFFNSGITEGDSFMNQRVPNSKNTLGYDIFILSIPNQANQIISNNVTELTLTMPASADRYYSFFTAFSISSEIVGNEEPEEPLLPPKEDKVIEMPAPEEVVAEVKEVEEVKEEPTPSPLEGVRNLQDPQAPKGFYNVVGVYITGISTERFKISLTRKGYKPDFIYDPASNKRYVYLERSETYQEAVEKQEEIRKNELFSDSWILAVNQD